MVNWFYWFPHKGGHNSWFWKRYSGSRDFERHAPWSYIKKWWHSKFCEGC
jgi:hypothetical protein